MEWLNYHHLRYFHAVAQEGGLARAAARLHVSQPSLSEQIGQLEESLGEKLFRREGRKNRLTDVGQLVLGYADEIFSLGQEMLNAIKQRPGVRTLRLQVGVADSFPKLATNEILKPVFSMSRRVHVVCREGKIGDLVAQLAAHRLDIVLADEPSPGFPNIRTFSHALGHSGVVICAEKNLARRLKRGFPGSLHGSAALLPTGNTTLRRALEPWFRDRAIEPRVVAEFEDLALMKVMAAQGLGFTVLPDVALDDAERRFGLVRIGRVTGCRIEFHAITAERRIIHPAVAALTGSSRPAGR